MNMHQIDGFFGFREFYDYIFDKYNEGTFVEVGTWLGRSAAHMADKIKSSSELPLPKGRGFLPQ